MAKLLIDINCNRELCGACDHKDAEWECNLFFTPLSYNGTFQALRCDKCLLSEVKTLDAVNVYKIGV